MLNVARRPYPSVCTKFYENFGIVKFLLLCSDM